LRTRYRSTRYLEHSGHARHGASREIKGGADLETVKPFPAQSDSGFWPARRCPDASWMTHPTGLSNRAGTSKTSAVNTIPEGLTPLGWGRAVNETTRTEIPSSSGMGTLASGSACCATAANGPRHAQVFLRARGPPVSSFGFPIRPARQVAGGPCLVGGIGACFGSPFYHAIAASAQAGGVDPDCKKKRRVGKRSA
jgi:hypothetical protein